MLEFKEKGYSIDYVSLAKAWTEGWRPVDMDTMEVNPVPSSYDTTVKSLISPEELQKELEDLVNQSISNRVQKQPKDKNSEKYKKSQASRQKYELGKIERTFQRDTTGMNIPNKVSLDDY